MNEGGDGEGRVMTQLSIQPTYVLYDYRLCTCIFVTNTCLLFICEHMSYIACVPSSHIMYEFLTHTSHVDIANNSQVSFAYLFHAHMLYIAYATTLLMLVIDVYLRIKCFICIYVI